MSIITPQTRERMAAHTIQEQLSRALEQDRQIRSVEALLSGRRRREEAIVEERRLRNTQRRGFDRHLDEKDD